MGDGVDEKPQKAKVDRSPNLGPVNLGGKKSRAGKNDRKAAAGEEVLSDFKTMYKQPASEDKTPGQARARKLFLDQYEKFLALYVKLEDQSIARLREQNALLEKGSAGVRVEEAAVGDRELLVGGLIDQLLEELGDGR